MMRQFGAYDRLLPYKKDADVIVTGGEYRTFDFGLGSAVCAHRVNGDRCKF